MANKWEGDIELDIVTLISGDFAAGAALITFGALLGKTTPLQMLFIVVVEMMFYSLNESIGVVKYEAYVGSGYRTRAAIASPCTTMSIHLQPPSVRPELTPRFLSSYRLNMSFFFAATPTACLVRHFQR
jgi:hypothetical protein